MSFFLIGLVVGVLQGIAWWCMDYVRSSPQGAAHGTR